MEIGKPFAALAAAQLCDLSVGLKAMTKVVRIPRGRGGRDSRALCVHITVKVKSKIGYHSVGQLRNETIKTSEKMQKKTDGLRRVEWRGPRDCLL